MSKKTFGNPKADRTKTNFLLELLQLSILILLFPLFWSCFSLPFTSKLPCIWTLLLKRNALASHQKGYLTAPTHQWQKWSYCSFLPILVQGLTTITESGVQLPLSFSLLGLHQYYSIIFRLLCRVSGSYIFWWAINTINKRTTVQAPSLSSQIFYCPALILSNLNSMSAPKDWLIW